MAGYARREFLKGLGGAAAGSALFPALAAGARGDGMKLGLVTYQWGKDMTLPELISACESSRVLGLELRTHHAHGVEPSLSKTERAAVKKRFGDSPVTLVGYGSNAQFHEPDPARVKANIELTKKYIHLMHDCGGSGVKVKPNGLPKGVPHEQTIEQIGRALNVVGAYGADYGQKIRVECHGRDTSRLPVMKAIFDVADHPNVYVCWNSNKVDTEGGGLEYNFNLVKDRLGDTVHVRELDRVDYPYPELMKLFLAMDYQGWLLLECSTERPDKVAALKHQRKVFEELRRSASMAM